MKLFNTIKFSRHALKSKISLLKFKNDNSLISNTGTFNNNIIFVRTTDHIVPLIPESSKQYEERQRIATKYKLCNGFKNVTLMSGCSLTSFSFLCITSLDNSIYSIGPAIVFAFPFYFGIILSGCGMISKLYLRYTKDFNNYKSWIDANREVSINSHDIFALTEANSNLKKNKEYYDEVSQTTHINFYFPYYDWYKLVGHNNEYLNQIIDRSVNKNNQDDNICEYPLTDINKYI